MTQASQRVSIAIFMMIFSILHNAGASAETAVTPEMSPRPWGDTFVPRSNPTQGTLWVVDTRELGQEKAIALGCLQGLISRESPDIWLTTTSFQDTWLKRHQAMGHFPDVRVVDDWRDLFKKYADKIKGVVIPDPKMYRGDLLALNVAAMEDAIVASPHLRSLLGDLDIVMDMRGKHETYADGLQWLYETYEEEFNRHLSEYIHPIRLKNAAFAYSYQWKAPMFWIVGMVDDAQYAGTDMRRETEIVSRFMERQMPHTAVLGFPFHGEGVGPGEVRGVWLASRYAVSLVCTDNLTNASVTSGVRVGTIPWNLDTADPIPLEDDKMYITMVLSDGDNQNTWIDYMENYLEVTADMPEFSLSFGIGPPILDLQPGVAKWHIEHAPPGTEYIADVSGIGYMQPGAYGKARSEIDDPIDAFVRWTDRYIERMNIHGIRTVSGGDALLKMYSGHSQKLGFILADMGRYPFQIPYDKMNFMTGDNIPVFRSVTSWRYGKDYWRDVKEQVPKDVRPVFLNGFVHVWTFQNRMEVAKIVADAPDDVVFVTPSQLADLYQRHLDSTGTAMAPDRTE
jgi:GxGYxYP putative glycoside hydrolase C-terminal domain/GxGYxYP_N second domain